MKKETRKEIKISFLIVLSLFLIGYFLPKIMFMNTNVTCGQITGENSVRGNDSFLFHFYVNGNKCNGSVSLIEIKKNISFDSLKQIKCLKIEYSNYSSFFSRVVDERVLRE